MLSMSLINKMRLFANQLYLVNNSGELYQYNIINRDWNSLIASELSATPNNLNLTAFVHGGGALFGGALYLGGPLYSVGGGRVT